MRRLPVLIMCLALAAAIFTASCSSPQRWPATCTLASDTLKAELVAIARECKSEIRYHDDSFVRPRVIRDRDMLRLSLDMEGVSKRVDDFYKFVDHWYRREMTCCPFLKMSLDREPGVWLLEIWTDPPCPAALDEYQKIFSQ